MSGPSAQEFVRRLAERVEAGEPVAVATVVSIQGSASARPGAKALLDAQGRLLFGWVGGGCAERSVGEAAREVLAERRPRLIHLDLDDEVMGVGMPCGGFMDIYIEPWMAEPKLLILGHGAIAEALLRLGKLLEFHVTVNDALAGQGGLADADVSIQQDPDYSKVECDAETYVVVTTQHRSDYEALSQVLSQTPAYVGVVASRKRSALLLERLHEEGVSVERLRGVSAPAGLDLAAQTPQEIALSIVAEILQRRRDDTSTGRPLVEVKGAVVHEDGVEIPEGPDESPRCPR